MKPLVYYCRWQGASLRLRGRDDTAVWGQLIFTDRNNAETSQTFHFNLANQKLTLTEPDGERLIQLDKMGTIVTK
ncbi:MAG: hypothetical protein GY796_21560 [Chloroflexi bacterium]|nr:hypothetical protein [Chloroflexota bacterium]